MERIYHARAAKKLGLRTQLTYGKKTKAPTLTTVSSLTPAPHLSVAHHSPMP